MFQPLIRILKFANVLKLEILLSMSTPWKVNGNYQEGEGFEKSNFLNESMTLKWNFRRCVCVCVWGGGSI